MQRNRPRLLKPSPIIILRRLALAMGRVPAQRAEGLVPIYTAPGDPAPVNPGRTGGTDGANRAGTRKTCRLCRPPHGPFLAHLDTSFRGQARRSVPGSGTSR